MQDASYVYDGDGNMVRGTVNGVITYYPARGYNKQVDGIEITIQKHYTFGSQTIALRVNGALNWVLGDHLGSTSVTANADGSFKSQIQYTAFGEVRASLGLTESEYRYTGQLRQAELGLYYYVARWYDPYLKRFVQADSIVPGGVQGLDRYAYVFNNPLKYVDPSGHLPCQGGEIILDGQVICMGAGSGGGSNQQSDPVRLTQNCEIQFNGYCSSGDQMVELHNWYKDNPGQWNNYGQDDFTTTDFLTWIVYMEIGYAINNENKDIAQKLLAEKLMLLCTRYSANSSCTTISDNAIYNYLATRASAKKRFDVMKSGKNPDPSFSKKPPKGDWYKFKNSSYSDFQSMASYAVGYNGLGSNADWGNLSMFTDPITQAALKVASQGTEKNQYLYKYPVDGTGNDPLYYFSSLQADYWHCMNKYGGICP